jgi:hypothetical protein
MGYNINECKMHRVSCCHSLKKHDNKNQSDLDDHKKQKQCYRLLDFFFFYLSSSKDQF